MKRQCVFLVGLVCALLVPGVVFAASLTVESMSAKRDDTITINIQYLAEGASVSALNFDLLFDETQLVLNSVNAGPAAIAATKEVDSHTPNAGLEKVIVYGLNSVTISDGTIIACSFSVAAAAIEGDTILSIANQVASDPMAAAVAIEATNGIVSVDETAPVVTVISHSDGDTVAAADVTLEGTVDDLGVESIDINGTTVTVTDGSFTHSITLSEGLNAISITAEDALGNSAVTTLNITLLSGDLNEDGIIDVSDVDIVRDQVLGVMAHTTAADMNNDGFVNVLDVQLIVNKI